MEGNAMVKEEDLEKAEVDAISTAAKHVANMLQRPDQLERVEQYRRRVARKKASVEARLKTAVQSQLDGVKTGLGQLGTALQDVQEVQKQLNEVEETYKKCHELNEKLKEVKAVGARHSQLASAVENLKHIFTVPETVEETQQLINENKLLRAHKLLADLETSRDDLLHEMHKLPSPSPTDNALLRHYFADVGKLSDSMAKQLWYSISRALSMVRKDPTMLVTALRIIEREERTDKEMLQRQKITGFLPPGRPKKWRETCFKTLEVSVATRIEGHLPETRDLNKMWLVRHLEITRKYVLEDLKVVKVMFQQCFPPDYNIFQRMVSMYHNALSVHLQELISDELESNEIISLLMWYNAYESEELMGNHELEIDTSQLTPLLTEETTAKLQQQYLKTLYKNVTSWTTNTLNKDVNDWQQDTEPEADGDGYYLTQLPVIVFQIIWEHLEVAALVSPRLKLRVVDLLLECVLRFTEQYQEAITTYKTTHFEDRSGSLFFTAYMIAIINNCLAFKEYTQQLKTKHLAADENQSRESKIQAVIEQFTGIGKRSCHYLLDEVFTDLEPHLKGLVTRQWVTSDTAVDTICVTVEDYCRDYVHLKQHFFVELMVEAEKRVTVEYIMAMIGRRISFKNYEDRKACAEKVQKEAAQLIQLFSKLAPSQEKSPCEVLKVMAEVIKLQDTAFLSLELSGLVKDYPDIQPEHIQALLALRGDVSRSEARQLANEVLGDEAERAKKPAPPPGGMFAQITMQPTMPLIRKN
ncbi:exocyst complex component 3-like [Branchiostoma floridae x Branchiostoma belcheri]